jgi:heat shock protein HtpX
MGAGQATFRDLIAANKRASLLLVILFSLFVTAVALILGIAVLAYLDPRAFDSLRLGPALAAGGIAALISLVISFLAYYAGSDMVLAISRARPLEHSEDPELYNVVEEMAIAAGIPMPKVYEIDDNALNAFATGRDPQHAVVCITRGLRTKLNREELQGVIAHEISHIRNYDIRLMLLMAVLVGTVAMLADFFRQMLWYSGRGSSRSEGKGGIVAVVLVVIGLILSIIAPILAHLIQLAVSRQREYLADASAVELTRYPQGLANALRKIDADPHDLATANRGTAHLFIANPIEKFEKLSSTAFSSHPPIQDRIRRLEALVHA